MPARFARYEATAQHNQAVNARQFGGTVEAQTGAEWVSPLIPPNRLYADELTINVGGVTFELHHARGETDDHTWVYCPDRGVLCPGDLIIWGVPNAGNPQKVQRYPWDWAAALRAMAAKQPRSLAPGHGGPVIDDAALVGRILTETADYLDAVVQRTLAVLEDGSPPHVDVVHAVELPHTDSPWLQPVYDEGQFIVRNIIRYYGGWFTGRPSELKPAPRHDVAAAVAALAGSAAALAEAATQKAAAGELEVACHLADFALEADPADGSVQQAVAAIYDQRAAAETSLMAINLMNSAAAYARAGRPFA
jgi:glyoxylase-like metal-dependent hydrolase (beta-lactamase superfamily II)